MSDHVRGEDILRIEHKLDAIIFYLAEMTGTPPRKMPNKIPGLSTLTGGKCPITGTDIHYILDVKTGQPRRKDGMHSGVLEVGPISSDEALSAKFESVMLKKGSLSED